MQEINILMVLGTTRSKRMLGRKRKGRRKRYGEKSKGNKTRERCLMHVQLKVQHK